MSARTTVTYAAADAAGATAAREGDRGFVRDVSSFRNRQIRQTLEGSFQGVAGGGARDRGELAGVEWLAGPTATDKECGLADVSGRFLVLCGGRSRLDVTACNGR